MKTWALPAYRFLVVAGFVLAAQREVAPGPPPEKGTLRTSPTCDEIIGYSGPNDCAIRIDDRGHIISIELLRSGDTVEHAAAVRNDPNFLSSFIGRSARDGPALSNVDAVSRATLTSLAIVEAVAKRVSGSRPSLRFPDPITLAEVRKVLQGTETLEPKSRGGIPASNATALRGPGGRALGFAVRSGPVCEDLVGYQGPTDTLLVFDHENRLRGIRLRTSYDNAKYVGYVREDAFFPAQFLGKTLGELILLGDPNSDPPDGVSGATMTSQSIAAGISRLAGKLEAPPPPIIRVEFAPRGRDLTTLIAIAIALLMTFSRLRSHRGLRIVTRLAVVGYLGYFAGEMLSLGLFTGWIQNGLPSAAPGLVALAGAALLIPVSTGRQTYCHQLCAHGALQEMVRRSPWRRPMPSALYRWLRHAPAILLALALIALTLGFDQFPTHALEPFGAWAWPMAGMATVTLWLGSMAFASFYPMAYCRVGCPTGALLEFSRMRGAGDGFRFYDIAAGFLLCTVVAARAAGL